MPRLQAGFTILEALLAAVIISASLGALAMLSTSQWANSKDVDILNRAENAIATDLGWLKTYAKYWRMSSGPYNLTATQTGARSYTVSSNTIDYEPDKPKTSTTAAETRCSTPPDLAVEFIKDASSDTAITPSKLFSIPNNPSKTVDNNTVLDNTKIGLPSGWELTRTIRFTGGTDGTINNTVYLTYALTYSPDNSTKTTPLRLVREVALRPEAASWCP